MIQREEHTTEGGIKSIGDSNGSFGIRVDILESGDSLVCLRDVIISGDYDKSALEVEDGK